MGRWTATCSAMIPALCLALGARAAVPVSAGEPRSAADVTEDWRGWSRVLDRALAPEDPASSDPRTLVLLLGATQTLSTSGFLDALPAALERNAAILGRLKVSVARVGADKPPASPSDDPGTIVALARQACAAPSAEIQDVYADLRALALGLAARPGERAILLVALDDGDLESDLEGTVARLQATKTRVHVVAGESYVADSFWAERPTQPRPRDTELRGGDAAVIDLPFGWLFQMSVANEVTPSSFACFGLNRVAGASGGRVFVHRGAHPGAHVCAVQGSCLVCQGDHVAESETYAKGRLATLAPSIEARDAALDLLALDPCHRATLDAWRAMLQAGIVRGTPPRDGRATTADPGAAGRAAQLLAGTPGRNAERAQALLQDCDRIQAAFDAALKRADPAKSSARQRAIAEYTRVMLQLTKTNLVTFAGWCAEIAPRWFDGSGEPAVPPEVEGLRGDPKRAVIGWTNRSLCHGVKPFFQVELPGGARLAAELATLDLLTTRFLDEYAHTPYAVALHRQGVATFHQAFPSLATERPRPRSKSSDEPAPRTGGERPPRAGGTGSGSGTGPATGGGR